MKIRPYLSFDGDCREAFEHYAAVLGGRILTMNPFRDAPGGGDVDPGEHDRIMHACLDLGGQQLMGTDATTRYPYHGVVGAHVVLEVAAPDEAERVFGALADRGHIEMPLAETFWARRFGITVDRFGVPWMVSCAHAEAGSAMSHEEEIA